MNIQKTNKEYIEKAIQVHKDIYDYSLVDYKNNKTKIKIICSVHGVFLKEAKSHLLGYGCTKCNRKNRSTKEDFLKKAKTIHGDTYDYSLVDYKNSKTKVKIICKEHGIFEQRPSNHLQGQGCKKCVDNIRRYSNKDFTVLAKKIHNDDYNYKKVDYRQSHSKVTITCKRHGDFKQEPNSHLQGVGCPKCTCNSISKSEQELQDWVKTYTKNVSTSNREVLKGKELDIYLPLKNLAIEYNGLYWHSDKFKDKNYHLNKTIESESKGVQLIHIFEDEWDNKKEIVKSRLANITGFTENKVYARKTTVKQVPTSQSMQFLEENHIQGKLGSKIKLGLYYENELISIMTFGKLRKSLGGTHKDGHWELLRFCNKLNTTVVGGFSKLLSFFKKNYDYKEIISYCDLRWGQGNVYFKNGFQEIYRSKPNYFYVKNNLIERLSRFKFRKSELVKQGFDKNLTEHRIMSDRGFRRIYDCGTIKFKIIKK